MSWYNPSDRSRELILFWLKSIALLLGLLAGLLFGVQHFQRFDTVEEIKANLAVDTDLTILGDAGLIFRANGREYCRISGRYSVKNIGKYGYYGQQVELTVWELPFLDDEIRDEEAVGFALSTRLDDPNAKYPGTTVTSQIIPVGESFAPQNVLQRSFGFIFPINRKPGAERRRFDSYYVVEANARAALKANPTDQSGLDGGESSAIATASYCGEEKGILETRSSFGDLYASIGNPGVCFNKNDLRHISATFYCQEPDPNEGSQKQL